MQIVASSTAIFQIFTLSSALKLFFFFYKKTQILKIPLGTHKIFQGTIIKRKKNVNANLRLENVFVNAGNGRLKLPQNVV